MRCDAALDQRLLGHKLALSASFCATCCYMYYSLNSLNGGYMGDYIGDYCRGN